MISYQADEGSWDWVHLGFWRLPDPILSALHRRMENKTSPRKQDGLVPIREVLSSKPCLPTPRRMKQADGCGPPHSLPRYFCVSLEMGCFWHFSL